MENTQKMMRSRILETRLEEMSLHEKIVSDLRTLELTQTEMRDFCETDLAYSIAETRQILILLGLILTSEQMKSSDPVVQTKIDRLKSWRAQRARKEEVPAYRVLTNRALMLIAQQCPKTQESLLEVKGFGQKMATAYGTEIVEIICH